MNKKSIITYSGLILVLLALANCTFKKAATEVPGGVANRDAGLPEEGIPKTFFVNPNGTPKTFLCGWAPVTEITAAAQAGLTHNAPLADHCNMEFEITEKYLIGKIISPSFPNERKRWKVGITIPITKHYYYEKEKDENGREKNRYIENESRSHWSARPYIGLDLNSLSITDSRYGIQPFSSNSPYLHTIEDVEWDLRNGFVGFTATYAGQIQAGYGAHDSQARIRINFKEFTHNPKFVKTPFNDKNYRHMNVLHVTGEKTQGVYPILYAARWDLEKTHDIYLVGFPAEFEPMAEKVVEEWNQALIKIGATKKKAFRARKEKLKYSFDLRYTTLTWIADRKIAEYSPLGIAMTHVDVRNGEMLWGGITVYGGYIEEYIKSNMPSALSSSTAKINNLGSFILNQVPGQKGFKLPLKIQDLPNQIGSLNTKINLTKTMAQQFTHFKRQMLEQNKTNGQPGREQENASFVAEMLKRDRDPLLPHLSPEALENIDQMFNEADQISKSTITQHQAKLSSENFNQMMMNVMNIKGPKETDADKINENAKTLEAHIKGKIQGNGRSAFQCLDRTFADVGSGWSLALAKGGLDYNKALDSIVKELISHEYGHFLGLGHQFKENILPAQGTVPENIYTALKAKAENGMTNYTSVMGYRHPEVEMRNPADEIVPGIQDELVLRYLYKREYPVYKPGDADFTFVPVPGDGVVPPHHPDKPEYKTAYMPQCNDIQASLSMDPYCNRFDRGYDAKTLVQGYFRDLRDGLVKTLFTYTDARGGDPELAEYMLWARSLPTMGRVRFFYDYMRAKYNHVFDQIRDRQDLLFQFSSACQDKTALASDKDAKASPESRDTLLKIFAENPELKELCQANAYALAEIEKLVSLKASDYTKLDLDSAYVPGGLSAGDAERDWSRFLGTWKELTAVPLKYSAIYAVTTVNPWFSWGPWAAPIYQYDNPAYRFAYSSLYPIEYTKVYSAAIKENLFFSKASIGQSEHTSMGRSILGMSYMSWMTSLTNDTKKLPQNFNSLIANQSQFDFSVVAIILAAEAGEGTSNMKKKFTGTVYDLYSRQTVPATEVYILPEGQAIASAQGMFLFPMPQARLRFLSDNEAYILAYRVTYSKLDLNDPLTGYSIKTELQQLNDQVLKACIVGQTYESGKTNGLASFFNRTEPDFKGFRLSKGIATDDEMQKNFLKSVNDSFETYYGHDKYKALRPSRETCRESLRGLGLIVSTTAVMNGFWLPEVDSYMDK